MSTRIEPESIRRVLIRGTNWVGDAVMSVPAIREVRRLFPRAHITLLIRPWVRDVYSAAEFIDELLIYEKDGRHDGIAGRHRLVLTLRSKGFDLAILLQNAFDAAALAWWARIPFRVGYRRDARGFLLTHPVTIDPEVKRVHQAYYYLGILSGMQWIGAHLWTDPDYRLRADLAVHHSDRAKARALLAEHGIEEDEPLIGLNAGASYGGAKRWLPDRFAQVAEHLARSCRARVLLVGSKMEEPIARAVAARIAAPCLNLAGQTTLGLLMGLLKECSLLITNDSGPMHLAAALDVPQVAVFGSTSEIATGPLSAVAEVVKNPVECSPCFLRECPIDLRCMTGVSVAQVIEAAERALARGRRRPETHRGRNRND
ncbi:MAG: lipopolysaccharide heptosyltransferase II [Acidobacteria bacterium]|nr:lipopolysaccharide heptosyltransferase II [Acidobacteriota bacterium]